MEETLSKRLDADKLVFSPKLNPLQMNALQCAQNADSIRLKQLYQAIRNLEASLANKRRALGIQHDSRLFHVSWDIANRARRNLSPKLARPLKAGRFASFNPSCSNSSANTGRFTNAIPKSSDSRPMPIEVLNINSSRNAPRSLFDYPLNALTLSSCRTLDYNNSV